MSTIYVYTLEELLKIFRCLEFQDKSAEIVIVGEYGVSFDNKNKETFMGFNITRK